MGFPDDTQADPFRQGRSATNDLLGGLSSRSDLLETQSQALQTDAMELMQRALTNAPQVTAQQGIAAALLAAIPTLGGALIGRSVGSTKIPQGMYGVKGLDNLGGMSAGGAMGAEIGGKASQDFLTRLDRTKETTPILLAQANIKNQQGNQLAQQANAVENARLQGQLNIDMMPLEEQSRIRVAQASATANAGRSNTYFDMMSPEQKKAYIARQTGVDAQGNPIPASARNSDLPVAAQNELAERKALIDAATTAATNVTGFSSWASLQAARTASGLDPKADILAIQDLADRALRSRSGAAAPPAERDQVSKFVQGDLTASPALVANFLKKYAERERQFGASQLNAYETLNNPEARNSLFAPPVDPNAARIAALEARAAALAAKAGQ